MGHLIDLFEESAVTQFLLTIGLWAIAGVLMLSGRPVPDLLAAGCGAVVGFWFSSKTTRQVSDVVATVVAAVVKPPGP
jgi:hypothetical protein